jgi:hypothetical protein
MQCAEAACAPTGLRTLAPFGGSLGTGHFLEGNGGEKKAGSEHRRLCLCVGAVRCGLSWATPEGSPVSHSGSVKKPDRRLMHYLQLDPSRSNLPKDSTGRIKGGPGRKKGAPNVLSRLSKDRIARVFEELGGVKGMYDWVRKDPKNEYAFYVHIWPKLLGAETVDAEAERLAQRPAITRIENVIIDPKDDYRDKV